VALDLSQHAVEQRRAQRALFANGRSRVFKTPAGMNLLERRLIMHPIDKRQRLLSAFLRGDIGEDHEFLDQFVRVERSGRPRRSTVPSGFSRLFRSGRSRSSGAAFVRASLTVGSGVQRFENRIEQRARDVVGPTVDRGLACA